MDSGHTVLHLQLRYALLSICAVVEGKRRDSRVCTEVVPVPLGPTRPNLPSSQVQNGIQGEPCECECVAQIADLYSGGAVGHHAAAAAAGEFYFLKRPKRCTDMRQSVSLQRKKREKLWNVGWMMNAASDGDYGE